mgnify:CR=1 FL=1
MDVKKASEAIGFFELAGHLTKVRDSKEAVRKAGADMPLPEGDVQERIQRAASWLLGFDKDKYMFLVPEIALMEEMGKQSSKEIETILTIHAGWRWRKKKGSGPISHAGRKSTSWRNLTFRKPFIRGTG